MADPLGIGLIGCGTVGSGVVKLLLEEKERLSARATRDPVRLGLSATCRPADPVAEFLDHEMDV